GPFGRPPVVERDSRTVVIPMLLGGKPPAPPARSSDPSVVSASPEAAALRSPRRGTPETLTEAALGPPPADTFRPERRGIECSESSARSPWQGHASPRAC